jgi:GW (Gly-Tryp) dipeptide domain
MKFCGMISVRSDYSNIPKNRRKFVMSTTTTSQGVLKSNDPSQPNVPVRIRSTPSTANQSNIKLTKAPGTKVTVLDKISAEGRTWYKVSYGPQATDIGWVREDVIKIIPNQNPSDAQTRVYFETDKRLVRVFEEGANVFMNVYNKISGKTELNRVPATKLARDQKGWEGYLATKDGLTYQASFIRRGATQLRITSSNNGQNVEPTEVGFASKGVEYQFIA